MVDRWSHYIVLQETKIFLRTPSCRLSRGKLRHGNSKVSALFEIASCKSHALISLPHWKVFHFSSGVPSPPPPMYPGHTLAFLTIYSLWNPYHEPEVPNPIFASELKNQVQKGSFHTTQGRQEWNAWPSLFLCNPSPRWTLLILEPGCGKSSQEKLRFWRKRDRWEKSCHCFIHSFVFISSDLCPAFPLFKEAMPEPSNDQRNTIPKQQTQCKTLQIWKTINQEDKNVKACSKSSVSKSLRK